MTQITDLRLRAGQADITPLSPLQLFGRTGRQEAVDNVKSRLEASCLSMERAGTVSALVTIDSLYPSHALADAILAALACRDGSPPLSPEALLLVASHTHNAPALDPTKPKLGTCDPEYVTFVAERIADCLTEMYAAPAPIAVVKAGMASCAASRFRRRKIAGIDLARGRFVTRMMMAPNTIIEINQRLRLLVFSDAAGKARAVLWSWPCHAVSEPDSAAISADFCGFVRDRLRTIHDDQSLPVLYFPGFSADIRPASRSHTPLHQAGLWIGFGPRFAKAGPTPMRALHSALDEAITQAMATLDSCGPTGEMTFTRQRRHLDINALRTASESFAPLSCDEWRLGPITIKALSAEIASGYDDIRSELDPLSFLTGCSGQVFGYIPMDDQLAEGGYEVDGFAPAFSVSGTFRHSIDRHIRRLMGSA